MNGQDIYATRKDWLSFRRKIIWGFPKEGNLGEELSAIDNWKGGAIV
jgi:hypothetical protein